MDERLKAVHTLHISGGFACNDDCVFCTDKGPGVPKVITKPRVEDVRRTLERNVHVGIVDFSTLEVTLNKNLIPLIKYASELGYHTISISTNGRKIGRKNGQMIYELLEAGLNRFHISIHGHNAEVHNRITQRNGSFEESVQGLQAACDARKTHPYLEIFMHSTICKLNYEYLPEMVEYYLDFDIEHYGLNCLQYQGAVHKHPELVAVQYQDVIAKLQECMPADKHLPLSVSEIPLCIVARTLPIQYYGIREEYNIHIRDEKDAAQTTLVDPTIRGFVKGPPCKQCAYQHVCDGVWEGYAKLFGFDDFQPLTENDMEMLHFEREANLQHILSAPANLWEVREMRRTYEEAIAVIDAPKLPRPLEISIAPRNDEEPAYRRTRRYNFGLRGQDNPPEHLRLAELLYKNILHKERNLPVQPVTA